jgi:hypothetical protein
MQRSKRLRTPHMNMRLKIIIVLAFEQHCEVLELLQVICFINFTPTKV